MIRFQWMTVVLLVSCAPSEVASVDMLEDVGTAQQEIVGGTIANGDPAVVAVAAETQQFCTGTLIAPRTVLTAAHCVNSYGNRVDYYVEFGTDSSRPSRRVRITGQFAHPNYNGQIRDLALLRLESAVTNVTPIPLNTTPFKTEDIGRDIRHVGFGITNASTGAGGGIKREVTYPLRRFDAWLLDSAAPGKNTCSGDSGGPGLMKMGGSAVESVVGVVSWGDQACTQLGIDARVDTDITWIRTTMAGWEAPSCEEDGRCVEGCATPDQDCVCVTDGTCNPLCRDLLKDSDCPKDCVPNGVCSVQACPTKDVDCADIGQTCASAFSCVSRDCIQDPQSNGTQYCTQDCLSSNECPSGMECSANRQCQFIQKPEKNFGELCTLENYCTFRGVCTGPVGEARRCTIACADATECPMGYSCVEGVDGFSFCKSPVPVYAPVEIPLVPRILQSASGCQSTHSAPWTLLGFMLAGLCVRRRRS